MAILPSMAPTAVSKPEGCLKKARLERACQFAEAAYERVTGLLSKKNGVLTVAEYHRMRGYSEAAQHLLKSARDILERHVSEHGC